MPIRTVEQKLDGLKEDRHIQIDGERICTMLDGLEREYG